MLLAGEEGPSALVTPVKAIGWEWGFKNSTLVNLIKRDSTIVNYDFEVILTIRLPLLGTTLGRLVIITETL